MTDDTFLFYQNVQADMHSGVYMLFNAVFEQAHSDIRFGPFVLEGDTVAPYGNHTGVGIYLREQERKECLSLNGLKPISDLELTMANELQTRTLQERMHSYIK